MVRHLILGLLLVGCEVQEPAKAPEHQETEARRAPRPPEEEPFEKEQPILERQEPAVPTAECDKKQTRVHEISEQLKEAREQREAYAKDHCKGTLKRETTVYPSGARTAGPVEAAWICDGKIVDVPHSSKEAHLAGIRGKLLHDMKEMGCSP